MARRRKDGIARAMDTARRALKRGKLGAYAYYPIKSTPKGKEFAFFVAEGDHALRFGRWIRRSK